MSNFQYLTFNIQLRVMPDSIKTKKQFLYLILCGIFLTNAIVAEIIGAKIFSVEATLGFAPVNIQLFGNTYDFNMSAGVLNWPFVFITSDIINEYFGRSGVKKISYLTSILIAYSFLLIYMATFVTPAKFWLDVNSKDAMGNAVNINEAFNMIFRQGMQIIVASITAFLLGQILDSVIFHRIRLFTSNKMIWLRATGSTMISQLIDSFVVVFLAFYVLAPPERRWDLNNVVAVASVNYVYKALVAILLTPIIYFAHHLIDKYLGKENANQMIEEATYV